MKFLVFAAFITVAVAKMVYPETYSNAYPAYPVADPSYSRSYDRASYETADSYDYAYAEPYAYAYAEPYAYAYAVKDEASNNDFSHSESRHGNVVTGEYKVALPDGRLQVVKYRADENGYNAVVTYEGEARYQEYNPSAYTWTKKNVYPAAYATLRY